MAVVGNAYVIVNAVTTGFNKQVQNAIKGINAGPGGQAVGQSFAKGFSKGGAKSAFARLRPEMEASRKELQRLVRAGYFLGPALSVGIAAVGSLASGLFALTSQVAAGLPALIVLPSIFSALAQAAATAKLAFGGIGKAIGAMTKQKAAGVDKMPAALERLANAQERLQDAEKRAIKTNEKLTDAYREARDEIEKINFAAEDAALSEKKAAIELEKARESLARVQDLPPNSRARREAELAFAEADLNLRQAKDANKDLADEQNRVTANGTRNADEQIRNLDSYKDAVEANEDAQKDVLKADKEVAKAKKEIEDIKNGKGGGGGGDDPTKDLSPEAVAFAKFIASLKPKLLELKAAAGKQLFPALTIAVQTLVDKLFPRLLPLIEETGAALGRAAISIADVITASANLDKIDTVMKTNNETIEKGGVIVGNLLDAFLSLLAAADPLVTRFTDWLVVLTDGWKETANANLESGKLTDTFNYAGDVVAQLGRIFGNLFTAIMDIGKSAAGPGSGGQMLLDMLEGATEKFQIFVDKAQEGGKLEDYFRNVATNVGKLGGLLVEAAELILRFAGRKEVGETADGLTKAVKGLEPIVDIFLRAAPLLGTFVTKLVRIIELFSETGSIEVFFSIIFKAMDIVAAIFSNPVVAQVFKYLAIIKAVTIAFSTLFAVARFYTLAIGGMFAKYGGILKIGGTAAKNMAGNFKAARGMGLGLFKSLKMTLSYTKLGAAATKVWTGIQTAFNAVMSMNPIVLVVIAIAALIAILVVAYFKVGWFRDFVDAAFRKVKDIIMAVVDWIIPAFQKAIDGVVSVFEGVMGFLSKVWDVIYTGLEFAWGVVKGIFEVVFLVIKTFVEIVIGILLLIWKPFSAALQVAWDVVKGIFTKFIIPIVTGYIETVIKIGQAIWGWLSAGLEFVWGIVKGIWDKIIFPIVSGYITRVIKIGATVWGWLSEGITKVWGIVSGFWNDKIFPFISGLKDKISSIASGMWDGLKNGLKTVINFIIKGLNFVIDAINLLIKGANAVKIGKDISLISKIPELELAQGGVVPATPGGVLARIGEAGRAERVEPLDEDGLSRRDRAMIQLLAGDAGGGKIYITVNPSPGMDEVELASLVSRQIARQIRRGAA